MKGHRFKKPTKKVREYARRLWDADKGETKQIMALEAGYSPSQARIPQRIEQTMGFRLATAEIANVFDAKAVLLQTADAKVALVGFNTNLIIQEFKEFAILQSYLERV